MRADDFKAERKRLGMTQKQLADELGVTSRQVRNWETGFSRVPPYLGRLLRGELVEPISSDSASDVAGLAARESEQ